MSSPLEHPNTLSLSKTFVTVKKIIPSRPQPTALETSKRRGSVLHIKAGADSAEPKSVLRKILYYTLDRETLA